MEYQSMYRLNEAQGRYVAETLNFHVSWWSIAQACIIVVTGMGQLFILRRFFTERAPATHSNAGASISP